MVDLSMIKVLGAMPKSVVELEDMTPQDVAKYDAQRAERAEINRHVVFGHDHRRDRNGNPIEEGIGSPGHESLNHWKALLEAERRGEEPPGTTARLKAEAAKRKGASA